jgi:hypothetical protein
MHGEDSRRRRGSLTSRRRLTSISDEQPQSRRNCDQRGDVDPPHAPGCAIRRLRRSDVSIVTVDPGRTTDGSSDGDNHARRNRESPGHKPNERGQLHLACHSNRLTGRIPQLEIHQGDRRAAQVSRTRSDPRRRHLNRHGPRDRSPHLRAGPLEHRRPYIRARNNRRRGSIHMTELRARARSLANVASAS